MRDFVVCCHAGFVDNTPIVDLNYAEECSNCADMPVAIMPNCGDTVRVGDGAEDREEVTMDSEPHADAEAAAGGDGVPQAQASGDSIVMMQLDRRLPLEHFESLGAECLLTSPGARTNRPTVALSLSNVSSIPRLKYTGCCHSWFCTAAVCLLQSALRQTVLDKSMPC